MIVLTLFVGVKTINEIKQFSYIGDDSASETRSITVSGEGEVFATADIATFNYSVRERGETVAEAENLATKKWNQILDYLDDAGVKEEDIKTTGYSISPVYENVSSSGFRFDNDREIVAYTVTQTAQVKVRDTDKTGEILSSVGDFEVNNLSGISFTIDDESELMAEAREKAIENAREKAKTLARNLGVGLDDVISYNENQGGYPRPYHGDMARLEVEEDGGSSAPSIPAGENRISVNVEVTYRIR